MIKCLTFQRPGKNQERHSKIKELFKQFANHALMTAADKKIIGARSSICRFQACESQCEYAIICEDIFHVKKRD